MGSLGNVLAAPFCPRMLGHDCCLAKTSRDGGSAQSHQHMYSMAMDNISTESIEINDRDRQDMVMDDTEISARSSIDAATQFSTSEEMASTVAINTRSLLDNPPGASISWQ